MTFDELNLNTPILNALNEIGIHHPTRIQEKSFSPVMSGKDVIGIAQTGTGKTFAYLLPILRQYKFSKNGHPKILILVPTRELVLQVVEEAEKLSSYITIRVAGVYGGVNINRHKELVYGGVDLVVATPGRLYDLAICGALKVKHIQKVVIDEVDEMLNLGFRPQLTSIMELLPDRRQNIMFSATLSKEVEKFINDFFAHFEKVEAAAAGTPIDKINQLGYPVANFYTKINLLKHLLRQEELQKVLVFTGNKKLADKVYTELEEEFEDQMGLIHSNKTQNFRINSLRGFEDGTNKVLIATDIVARGLDISEISHVINFDTPEIPENYIHRIGRTGRAEKAGTAITFITPLEETLQKNIEGLMRMEIPMVDFPEEVEIATRLTIEEQPDSIEVNYLPTPSAESTNPAFHEKKEKNKKVNLGGSYKRKIEAKYKKPKTRGQKPRGKKKKGNALCLRKFGW